MTDSSGVNDIWQLDTESMRGGVWWWWFWLFFWDTGKEKPEQMMLLWTSKLDKHLIIDGNDVAMRPPEKKGDDWLLSGAIAGWHFDGNKVNHDLAFEACDMILSPTNKSIKGRCKTDYSFWQKDNDYFVNVGEDFKFKATPQDSKFGELFYRKYIYPGWNDHKILGLNRCDLTGTARGKKIKGTAYFQRVVVNAPAVPWYWGIFHFEDGSGITYFNPHLGPRVLDQMKDNQLKVSVKKELYYYDAKSEQTFHFKKMKVKREGNEFVVTAKRKDAKISFRIVPYAEAHFILEKKIYGFLPKTKLTYTELPSHIVDFRLESKELTRTQDDLGICWGNAENTWGMII